MLKRLLVCALALCISSLQAQGDTTTLSVSHASNPSTTMNWADGDGPLKIDIDLVVKAPGCPVIDLSADLKVESGDHSQNSLAEAIATALKNQLMHIHHVPEEKACEIVKLTGNTVVVNYTPSDLPNPGTPDDPHEHTTPDNKDNDPRVIQFVD